MLRELFTALRSFPPIPQADAPRLAVESARAFDLIIDFLRGEGTFSHPVINALATLGWYLIGSKEIPVILDPIGKLPSLHFFCALHKRQGQDLVFYALPFGYLDLVRTDQIMQCCALVNMASQGCDYYARRLDPGLTPHRARAYEAELLQALRPLALAEGLPWKLNPYLEGVLHQYPAGLGSLSSKQRYSPPSYPTHSPLEQQGEPQ
jgi:hypothetical protein